jgi:F0F1-type ATP synthase membrane subunit b/b'
MLQIVLLGCGLLAVVGAGLMVFGLRRKRTAPTEPGTSPPAHELNQQADEGIDRVFNEEFREELRNRGRLYFEKIISENAMFLQQDLRLTTSQLNEFMKEEIKKTLREEFARYQESITTAKDLAIQSMQKTQAAIEEQRQLLEKQLAEQIAREKAHALEKFANNMADIVNHYVVAAIGKEVDLTAQLDYIFDNLEENKQAIIEDINRGS